MKILFVTAEYPFPSNSGGRIYTGQRIRMLAEQGNEVFLYSFYDKNEEKDYNPKIPNLNDIRFYDRKSKLNILRNPNKPIGSFTRLSAELIKDLEEVNEKRLVDLIVIDMPQLIYNLPTALDIPVIITFHNIESELMKSVYLEEKNIVQKIMYFREYRTLKKLEEKISTQANIKGLTFITEKDKDFYTSKYDIKHKCIKVIPCGIDFPKYIDTIENNTKGTNNSIIISFIGKMNYRPNVQAITWYATEVFPSVEKTCKNVRLFIVGKDPADEVKELHNDNNIIVTGTVDNISDYFNQSDIIVMPLLSGGGVKIKLIESAAYKKVIIATSNAVEGTEFIENKEILIANSKQEFVEKCVDVVNNIDDYRQIGLNIFKKAKELYDFEEVGNSYFHFIQGVILENC